MALRDTRIEVMMRFGEIFSLEGILNFAETQKSQRSFFEFFNRFDEKYGGKFDDDDMKNNVAGVIHNILGADGYGRVSYCLGNFAKSLASSSYFEEAERVFGLLLKFGSDNADAIGESIQNFKAPIDTRKKYPINIEADQTRPVQYYFDSIGSRYEASQEPSSEQ